MGANIGSQFSASPIPVDVQLAMMQGVDAARGTGMYMSMGKDAFAALVNQYASSPQGQQLLGTGSFATPPNAGTATPASAMPAGLPPDVVLALMQGVPAARGTGMYQQMGPQAFANLVQQDAANTPGGQWLTQGTPLPSSLAYGPTGNQGGGVPGGSTSGSMAGTSASPGGAVNGTPAPAGPIGQSNTLAFPTGGMTQGKQMGGSSIGGSGKAPGGA